jgi:hypothetical protein
LDRNSGWTLAGPPGYGRCNYRDFSPVLGDFGQRGRVVEGLADIILEIVQFQAVGAVRVVAVKAEQFPIALGDRGAGGINRGAVIDEVRGLDAERTEDLVLRKMGTRL